MPLLWYFFLLWHNAEFWLFWWSPWLRSFLFFKKAWCIVSVEIYYSFFENLRIRPNGYHYTLFTFILCSQSWSVSQCLSLRVCMAGKLCCRSLVFIYFIGDFSAFSFSSYFCSLSSVGVGGMLFHWAKFAHTLHDIALHLSTYICGGSADVTVW